MSLDGEVIGKTVSYYTGTSQLLQSVTTVSYYTGIADGSQIDSPFPFRCAH